MIVSEQLNYIKTRRFHAIFMPVLIEFSRCIGTYSSAKFEFIKKQAIKTSDRKQTIKTRNNQEKIRLYLQVHEAAKARDIAELLGLSMARTREMLSEMDDVETIGRNKTRIY